MRERDVRPIVGERKKIIRMTSKNFNGIDLGCNHCYLKAQPKFDGLGSLAPSINSGHKLC